MKQIYFLFALFIGATSFGQTLLNEHFDYGGAAGDLTTVSGGNWTNHSGSAPAVGYANTSLTMVSYPTSGVGGSATIVNPGSEDVNRTFSGISSGNIYASALVNISAMTTTGNYFFHFRNGSGAFFGRVYAKDDGSGNLLFGIRESGGTIVYGTTPFSLNTTYLLVLKYDFTAGSTSVYILSAVAGSEPGTPEATVDDGSDAADLAAIAFRQSGDIPTTTIDGVRVATTWNDIMNDSTDPTLTISDGPASGSSVVDSPELVNQVTIDFVTTNFVMSNDAGGGVSDGSGDGFIIWDVENTSAMTTHDSGSIFTSNDGFEYSVANFTAGSTYLLTAELVDNSGASLAPQVIYTLTVTVATYTDVANLGVLRASTVDNDIYYRVTGEVFNTFSRDGVDNQKYFQDALGAILIFDEDYEVSTSYSVGDGVTNMKGHLIEVSGVLQFVPTETDWGAATSTGSIITPQVVDIATLEADIDAYESRLIKINAAAFDPGDVGAFFVPASGGTGNYDITDASGTTTFRTNFGEVDYVSGSTPVPNGDQDLIVLVSEFFGAAQVTARISSDIVASLSVGRNEIEGFSIYPNPVNNKEFNISSLSNLERSVEIYDMLGKRVFTKFVQANERIYISRLNSGIYILKVEEEGKLATRKLVVE